jgi:hypothetical protein
MDSIPDDTALSDEIIEAKKGVLDKRAPGLYRDEELVPIEVPAEEAGFLAAAFAWLGANAESGALYRIVLGADETQKETLLYPGTLNNAAPVSVALSGSGNRRIIQLTGTGNMYGVRDGVALTAGAGIILSGVPGNYRPLIDVRDGGSFVMEEGSLLRGNTNILYGEDFLGSSGGGVGIRTGGSCVINGGEINGCEAYYGGGVALTGGALALNGGAIMSNVARQGGGGGVYLAGVGCAFAMDSGTICGNITAGYYFTNGGGVYGGRGSVFAKTGGVITAYTSLPLKGNKVTDLRGGISRLDSHAVYQEFSTGGSVSLSRTVKPGHGLDSRLPGKEGGWYDE